MRAAAFGLIGAIAEGATMIHERRDGDGLDFDVVTGMLPDDTVFAPHGHTLRLRLTGPEPAATPRTPTTDRPGRQDPRAGFGGSSSTPRRSGATATIRWLWSGQVVNGIGNQITRIALPYQVYVLTGSTLAIAALTLFQLIPILLFALGAGSLADAVDRRRLLLVTQAGLAACSLALVVLAADRRATGGRPVRGGVRRRRAVGAVDQPARSSAIPRLVPPERLPSAIALNQLNFQLASIVGPAIGGHPHRHDRAGRRVRGRSPVVHGVVRRRCWPSSRCRRSGSSHARA